MAKPISHDSDPSQLADLALQSIITLNKTIQGFNSHQRCVRDLVEELGTLCEALSSLNETTNALPDVDISLLGATLFRCHNACKDFEKEIVKSSSRPGGRRTSIRDWAMLRYMGEDIDGFRRLLGGYKLIIRVALTDANLPKSATSKSIENYNELVSIAKADLEDHLERIHEKFKLLAQKSAGIRSDAPEMNLIKSEQLSTQKGLEMCARSSHNISKIELIARRSTSGNEPTDDSGVLPGRLAQEDLRECTAGLAQEALKLQGFEKHLFNRSMAKSRTGFVSEEDREDYQKVHNAGEAVRTMLNIYSRADDHMKTGITVVDNYSTGDAVQLIVSTSSKTIHGRNQGMGWRTRQIAGHLSDESIQEIVRNLVNVTIVNPGGDASSAHGESLSVPGVEVAREQESKFKEQYGEGFQLTSKPTGSPGPSARAPAPGRATRSMK